MVIELDFEWDALLRLYNLL